MHAEYMVQVGMREQATIEVATLKQDAEDLQEAWREWLSTNRREEFKLHIVEGCTRSGGKTVTMFLLKDVLQISIVEFEIAKVTPLVGGSPRPS